ncbi:cell wall biogenesis protein-like protein Ecm15 [Lophiostoma macrostomum CBS 122681]|uniref:Cell wall biogenesis protein-like protein Ecm15 n=1 Tax=Lophiostoma macrostomum CBS 122681 TaxID=1314788 RepID=A0A6A6SVK1_9PLEO|nr:cell wall biogenesis protein-like protein Ecm15 [Lophiostoma macrostomum CBS 122681]
MPPLEPSEFRHWPGLGTAFHQLSTRINMSSSDDLTSLNTPPSCIADFCLIPLGTPTASVSKEVASVQRLLKKSGLEYSMHSAGTTVEGSWDDVMKVIGQCHAMLHQNGVVRIQSDIRVGTRTDKKQGFQDKVAAVERLLKDDE